MKTNESLKITVSSQTADTLRRMSAESNLTVGEVVDRLAINSSPTDPVLASLLITQKTLMILSNLDAEDHQKANTYLAYSIMSSCPPETLDKIVAEIKQLREQAIDTIDAIPDAIRAELTQALKNCTIPNA